MKKSFGLCLISLSAVLFGQTIETVSATSSNANRIVHVETAADHLTVIEVGEPVDTVAVGSKAFTVERRDDKVFVQSQEEHAKTNLFIWTVSHRRYIYELETSPSVADATFALDYPHVAPARKAPALVMRTPVKSVVEELLLNGTPVRLIGLKTPQILSGRVGVQIHDIYKDREKGEMLIRYSVQNGSKLTYQPGQPTIVLLQPASPPIRSGLIATRRSRANSFAACPPKTPAPTWRSPRSAHQNPRSTPVIFLLAS